MNQRYHSFILAMLDRLAFLPLWRLLHLAQIATANQFHGPAGIVGENLKLHRHMHEV